MPTTSTPAWKGASTGNQPLAGQVNQFLGTHAATFIYTGVSLGSSTVGSGTVATNGLYIAEQINPGSTQTPGRFVLTMAVTGTPGPLIISIQTNSGGAPSGTVIATTTVPYPYVPGTATAISIPLPCSLTGGTAYWLVANAVGDVSNFYAFSKSTGGSGVSTSPTGVTWTAQAYGITYNRFDQSVVSPLVHTYEDSGARWTTTTFNATATPNVLKEYTVAQAASDYVYSSRTFGYSGSSLTSLA